MKNTALIVIDLQNDITKNWEIIQMEEIQYKKLDADCFNTHSLDSFVRHQAVTECWREVNVLNLIDATSFAVDEKTAFVEFGGDEIQVIVNTTDGGVNVREGPGTEYDIVFSMVPDGTEFTIKETVLSTTGKEWGKVSYKGKEGWISMSQVQQK